MTEETVSPEQEIMDVLTSLGYEGVKGADQHRHVLAKLMTTDWEDLKTLEHNEYLLFPETLHRRNSEGKWEEKTVMLRVPRDSDLRKSRIEARAWAAKEKLDEDKDKDLFANMENMCILARCIRNDSSPYEPWVPNPKELEARYDKVCLQNMWEKLERLNDVLNPAPNQLSNGEIVALIVAIAKARHLGPLVVYGPGAQTSFVVSMADLLLNSVASKLSSESLERLMQAYSPSKGSLS
jgi:hypothetical protein